MTGHTLLSEHRAAGRFFTAGGVGSFVREQGDGEAVVCLHGVPASSHLYRKVLPELAARGLRGVAFDLPGFGLAARPADFPYGPGGHGAWVAEAVDRVGLERFHLVVHDYGGPVGFDVCARIPQRIRSLTILDTVLDAEQFRRPALIEFALTSGLGLLLLRALPPAVWHRAMLRIGVLDPAALTRAESDMWLELMRREDHGRAILRSAEGVEATAGASARYVEAVRALGVPKQLIWAGDDPILPPGRDGEHTRELAGAPLHLVAGRHFLQEEQPVAIAELVAQLARAATAAP